MICCIFSILHWTYISLFFCTASFRWILQRNGRSYSYLRLIPQFHLSYGGAVHCTLVLSAICSFELCCAVSLSLHPIICSIHVWFRTWISARSTYIFSFYFILLLLMEHENSPLILSHQKLKDDTHNFCGRHSFDVLSDWICSNLIFLTNLILHEGHSWRGLISCEFWWTTIDVNRRTVSF